ncbi:nitrite reductase small subunit NirD [Niallia endozanthoxylica]|uniref:Nitrite reductase small subunit NirD n=1 Tax=Niallia endozanthoxylica TaxID=2036016 RepID=A0A5J5HS61_9BACI|nr:nitrite reductase small subunit NirD [Niallia endozanthoxylica]KAA9023960.1 nitrite reductase small subunit NirD [Niallia endozanthoxylica]
MGTTLQRVKVAKVSEMPKNIGKTIKIGVNEIALFHLESGEFRAIENRCPHKGGVLVEGIVSGDYVFCPMHDWKISVVDGLVQKPDNGCVKTFQVEVDHEDVYILLS